MSLIEAVICGTIQGFAEFLPISSSGHLAIVHSVFNTDAAKGNLMFDLLLHLGTLIVVFVFYYKDIFPLIPAFFTMLGKMFKGTYKLSGWTKHERVVWMLMISTLPLAAAFFVKDRVEVLAAYPKIVGGILIVNGFALLLADAMSTRVKVRKMKPMSAFGMGCFQLCAAILPGLSRSGSTISGGILFGLKREEAVKFSFMMSVPAILGANLFSIPDALAEPISKTQVLYSLVGMAVAMVCGFCAMKCLLYITKKSKFGFFAYYCIAAGLLTVIFL